ncbi:MAG TPA: Fur family transcriptional regulator [Anaerolineales bacterium]|nr:Fur family transcriptional regulator [Anaerolineales bacterium]
MASQEIFASRLRKQGYRLTPQRLAILQILIDSGGHLTPQQVFDQARAIVPGITEPTVYRTLSFLSDEGVLMPTHEANGSLVYEVASDLHHHLVCRDCGESLEIGHDALASLYGTLKKQTGYVLDDRHITLFGLCPECQGN